MATRSMIARELEGGKIEAIYCHWDGYPDHQWPILTQHHSTDKAASELMSLGDLSVLGEQIGEKHDHDPHNSEHEKWCLAYGRDCGEADVEKTVFGSEKEFLGNFNNRDTEYAYLFRDGKWHWRTYNGRAWKDKHSEQ